MTNTTLNLSAFTQTPIEPPVAPPADPRDAELSRLRAALQAIAGCETAHDVYQRSDKFFFVRAIARDALAGK